MPSSLLRLLAPVHALLVLPSLALVHDSSRQPALSWDEALTSFADNIQRQTVGMEKPTVVLTLVGGRTLQPRLPELLVHYKQLAGLPLAVVALDATTQDFFTQHGVPSMLFALNRYGLKAHTEPEHWPFKEAIMRGKYEVTSLLLDRNVTVIMSEADVYWKSNPLVLMDELPGDFLVTEHQYNRGGEINVGFYIAKPTEALRRTFSGVRTWLNSDKRGETRCGCFDQVLLDFAVRCSRRAKLVTKCGFPAAEQDIVCDTNSTDHVPWQPIPWERLPHLPLHHRYGGANDTEMQEYWTAMESAVGTHVWGGFASGFERMAFAYEHGLWAKGVSPPPQPRAWLQGINVTKISKAIVGIQHVHGRAHDVNDMPCGCDDFVDDF